ncbi:PSD1 and planctomycete cytochrome C domain-containing protein [soil metagenome]
MLHFHYPGAIFMLRLACLGIGLAMALGIAVVRADPPSDDFEKTIRPLFIEHCHRCHGPEKQKGSLRLDTRDGALLGGDTGKAIVPGKPAESLLLSAVLRDGDLKMPPDKPLTEAQVQTLTKWIEDGAVWPKDTTTKLNAKDHWAFQPVRMPSLPPVKGEGWCQSPVDRFLLAKMESQSLTPAPTADRRTLIRRVTYDLTGLPPTYAEVQAFESDTSPKAYEALIDRLLQSPHYGEQWGRHWLDLARYSDSKGYVYAREEKFWVHAWTYRDWVVKALNDDMPYDRFVTLQLAADRATPQDRSAHAAMGFLTVGRRFLGVTHDIVDDRIDVVGRGLLGLTISCARCHNHKFDPVPTEDYYALVGVFRSSREKLVPLAELQTSAAGATEYTAKFKAESDKFEALLAKSKGEVADRIRGRIADYLLAQFELNKYPEEGFDVNILPEDLVPAAVRRWRDYLAREAKSPVWAAWNAFQGRTAAAMNPLVQKAFATMPRDREDLVRRYAALFTEVDALWKTKQKDGAKSLDDPATEEIRLVLYGADSPCEVPAGMMADIEFFFPTQRVEELWKQRRKVDRLLIEYAAAPPQALILEDRPDPTNSRVFRRGNPATPGDEVPRRFLKLFGGREFTDGSGRLELAKAITDPANPLTARVIVNRVWQNHFGQGLVRTPSDFGTRAEPPSHPELLDWLAATFVTEGWSLKKLHRTIMLSAAYQQASAAPPANDPENYLLSERTSRRLGFEELRDTLFAMTNDLDPAVGGRPVPLFAVPFTARRSIYGLIDREYLPGPYRIFDFANPDLHTPQRSDTTVPQQSLYFLNNPLPLSRARALALKCNAESPPERVRQMYHQAYQREPTAAQVARAVNFVSEVPDSKPAKSDWSYGYGDLNAEIVRKFTPFTTFNGDAWQLDSMKLTSEGGHAAEKHVVVRRWTSPIDGTIRITSKLQHKTKEGDGVYGVILSSRQGKLADGNAFKNAVELNISEAAVRIGDTIDFVVDHRKTIEGDEFLWAPVIATVKGPVTHWDTRRQFRGPHLSLTPWEQLAQVLLMANEFSFVD